MPNQPSTRRDFIKQTAAALCAATVFSEIQSFAENEAGIPLRTLGRTKEKVSILGIGGAHAGGIQDEQAVIRLFRAAIDSGVTFLDNAWEYNDGRSEELMGKALRDGYRQKAFLMTKHHGRKDKKVAMQHLEDSLRRLQTDVIDLWQFHEIVYDADPDMIFSKGGAIEAAIKAREQGKVRYIGFTGHKSPAIFKKMLAHDFEWDTVQMPVNVLDPHYRSFIKEIIPILRERNIGIIAMKTLCGGHLLQANLVQPEEALTYAWSQPVSTIVSGMTSMEQLRANVSLAKSFKPMTAEAQEKLLQRTKAIALDGKFEPFKSTQMYDGPIGRKIHGLL